MKIGILTYHRSRNYGAFLQACALCSRLRAEHDMEAEIIDFNMDVAEKFYALPKWGLARRIKNHTSYDFQKKRAAAFDRGIKKAKDLLSPDSLVTDNLEAFQAFVKGKYDVIIAGSDEIWKLDGFRGFPTPYWLIGDLACRKFSYAASSRSDFSELDQVRYGILCDALRDFEFISVRDQRTFNECEKALGSSEKLINVCDPSFLYDFSPANRPLDEVLKGKAKLDPSKKKIVLMLDDKKLYERLYSQLAGKYELISVFHRLKGSICVPDLDQFQWLEVIKNADLVISSFFHGICFSIVNSTPFIAVGTDNKRSKLDELLLGTDLENRYIHGKELNSTDWIGVTQNAMIPVDTRSFVENERKNFDVFLEKLRKEDK